MGALAPLWSETRAGDRAQHWQMPTTTSVEKVRSRTVTENCQCEGGGELAERRATLTVNPFCGDAAGQVVGDLGDPKVVQPGLVPGHALLSWSRRRWVCLVDKILPLLVLVALWNLLIDYVDVECFPLVKRRGVGSQGHSSGSVIWHFFHSVTELIGGSPVVPGMLLTPDSVVEATGGWTGASEAHLVHADSRPGAETRETAVFAPERVHEKV